MNELVSLKSYKEDALNSYADLISTDVVEGNTDPIAVYVQAKAVQDIAKRVIESIKDYAIDEAGNYSKAESIYNGANFSLKNTGDLLNYEEDQLVKILTKHLKDRKAELKQAYDIHNKTRGIVMDKDGEIVPVIGVKTEASTTISVSFKEKK
jgi:hypothetical protein